MPQEQDEQLIFRLRDALRLALDELYNCGAIVGMAQDERLVKDAARRADTIWDIGQAALKAVAQRKP